MKSENVKIKSKDEELGEFAYEYPETLEEALEKDGVESVFKLFCMQRKIRWMDAKRRELTGGGLPKSLTAKLKTLPKDKLEKLLAALEMEL